MDTPQLMIALQNEITTFAQTIATVQGDWVVKGFVDVYGNVYSVSTDTKVVSKVIELLLTPVLIAFAERNGLQIEFARQQNFYPDVTLITQEGLLFAVDLKTTYRTSERRVNGMTLGAFTGYFRNRASRKNCVYPYGAYTAHLVLGVIYSQLNVEEVRIYPLEQLNQIPAPIGNFQFFVQEKYRIASDRPGSGNTKNIGAVLDIESLVNGQGPFTPLGVAVFDDYWMYYVTEDMLRAANLDSRPYRNLQSYKLYRGLV